MTPNEKDIKDIAEEIHYVIYEYDSAIDDVLKNAVAKLIGEALHRARREGAERMSAALKYIELAIDRTEVLIRSADYRPTTEMFLMRDLKEAKKALEGETT